MRNHEKPIRGAYKSAITREMFESILEYNPANGLFVWKNTSAYHKAGDIAGTKNKRTGYICISAFGITFEAHRLAFLFMTGSWPTHDVDHENGVRDDNRWSELRAATRSENLINRVGFSKSGYKNICSRPLANGEHSYRVVIRRGETFFQSKTTRVIDEAIEWRDQWLALHGGEFTSTRHVSDTI